MPKFLVLLFSSHKPIAVGIDGETKNRPLAACLVDPQRARSAHFGWHFLVAVIKSVAVWSLAETLKSSRTASELQALACQRRWR